MHQQFPRHAPSAATFLRLAQVAAIHQLAASVAQEVRDR
jgi:hypothetical protein